MNVTLYDLELNCIANFTGKPAFGPPVTGNMSLKIGDGSELSLRVSAHINVTVSPSPSPSISPSASLAPTSTTDSGTPPNMSIILAEAVKNEIVKQIESTNFHPQQIKMQKHNSHEKLTVDDTQNETPPVFIFTLENCSVNAKITQLLLSNPAYNNRTAIKDVTPLIPDIACTQMSEIVQTIQNGINNFVAGLYNEFFNLKGRTPSLELTVPGNELIQLVLYLFYFFWDLM